MKKIIVIAYLIPFLFGFNLVTGQEIDTLSFYSEEFKEERTVYIHKPQAYKYKSKSIEFPVIYLLDGQHEWFINPILSDIKYLQYAHEIPNAIVVVIPLKNRNKECDIPNLDAKLPLDSFLTSELNKKLKEYNPSNFKILIGHSYSASFALYSFYNHPKLYSSVIANTPLNKIELLVEKFKEKNMIKKKFQ